MVDALTIGLAIATGLVAVVAAILFQLGKDRPRALDLAVYVVEAALVVRAMIGVGQMVSGDESRSVTHIGYLIASVAVLPLLLSSLEGDKSKWSNAVLAVGSLVVLIIVLRLQVTTGD